MPNAQIDAVIDLLTNREIPENPTVEDSRERFEQFARADILRDGRGKFGVTQTATAKGVRDGGRKGFELSSAGDCHPYSRAECFGQIRGHVAAHPEAPFPDRIEPVQRGVALHKKSAERFPPPDDYLLQRSELRPAFPRLVSAADNGARAFLKSLDLPAQMPGASL